MMITAMLPETALTFSASGPLAAALALGLAGSIAAFGAIVIGIVRQDRALRAAPATTIVTPSVADALPHAA